MVAYMTTTQLTTVKADNKGSSLLLLLYSGSKGVMGEWFPQAHSHPFSSAC